MSEGESDIQAVPALELNQKNSVEIFLTSLEKAIRSAKVYAYESGQHLLTNIYENVVNTLDRALQEEEEIDIHVKPHQMLSQRRVVYENKDKKSSLSYTLFQNGIRLVTFRKGLDRENLVKIIKTLATDFSKPESLDQDLYCLFVENPVDHFEVVGLDVLGDAQKDNPELKKTLSEFRKKIASKTAEKSAYKVRRVRQDDLKVLEEFHLNPVQFSRNDEEVAKIVQGMTSSHTGTKKERETLERLALMGFHFLLQENDVDQNQVGRNLIVQVALMMLDEEYLNLFSALVQKVSQLLKDHSPQRGEYQKILDMIFHVDQAARFRILVLNKEHQKATAEILLKGPPSTVRLMILLLGAESWCSRVFSNFILKYSPQYSNWLNEQAVSCPDLDCWEHLLNIFATNPNQLFSRFLTSLLGSGSKTIKLKVLRQCASIGTEETLEVFKRLLREDDLQDRELAYELLPLAKNKTALLILKKHIASKEFSSLSEQEKESAYVSMMTTAGKASYAWFESEWLLPGEGLFKSKHQNERRVILTRAAQRSQIEFIDRILVQTPLESLSKDLQALIARILNSKEGVNEAHGADEHTKSGE